MGHKIILSILLLAGLAMATAGSGGGGGGGGGGYRGGGGGSSGMSRNWKNGASRLDGKFLVTGVIALLSATVYLRRKKFKGQDEAEKILKGNNAPEWNKEKLIEYMKAYFAKIQSAWSETNLGYLEHAMDQDLFLQWKIRLETMKSNGQINKVHGVSIHQIDIVNVKDYLENSKDEFTAEIRFTAKDSISKNSELVRSQSEETIEFWTMSRQGSRWKLKEVMRSGMLASLSLALDYNVNEGSQGRHIE